MTPPVVPLDGKPPVGWQRVVSQSSRYEWKSERAGWLAWIGPAAPGSVKVVMLRHFDDVQEAVTVANGVMGR